MAKYFYAVRQGQNLGIYNTWAECEVQVRGYPGAQFKKFKEYEQALDFVNKGNTIKEIEIEDLRENEAIAYVDGSFSLDKKQYGYGVVLFTKDDKTTYYGEGHREDFVEMRNVAGEIKAAMKAMEKALEIGKDTLYIYYDYMGIEKWALGEWKTNKYGTKKYKEYYDSIKDQLRLIFIKVEAHSGNKYNDEADKLAKMALGIVGE